MSNIVVLEPRVALNTGGVLPRLNNLRNFAEWNLWVSPIAKTIKGVRLSGEFSVGSAEQAHSEAWKICRLWHQYGEFPRLLQYEGVDIGTVLEGFAWFLIYPLLRQIDFAIDVLGKDAGKVYIESDFTPLGKAMACVAAANHRRRQFIQPWPYRVAKNAAKALWHYKNQLTILEPSEVFGIAPYAGERFILFSCPHYSNYFNTLAPVVNQMRGGAYVLAPEELVRRKWSNYIPVCVSARRSGELHGLEDYYWRAEASETFQSLFRYRDISFWKAIEQDFDFLVCRTAMAAATNIKHFRRAVEEIKPNAVVVAFDESPSMRGHVLAAKAMGIPTIEVQHGLLTPTSVYAEPVSDWIAAGGESGKKVYVGAGVPEDRVVVTGFPKNDVYYSTQANGHQGCSVLFATNPIDAKRNLSIIEVLAKVCDTVVVKPHPAEKASLYLSLVKSNRNVRVRDSGEDIAPMIANCDVLVMENSSVGIEAAMMNKPIVNIGIGHTNVISPYVSAGVAINVLCLGDLPLGIDQASKGTTPLPVATIWTDCKPLRAAIPTKHKGSPMHRRKLCG